MNQRTRTVKTEKKKPLHHVQVYQMFQHQHIKNNYLFIIYLLFFLNLKARKKKRAVYDTNNSPTPCYGSYLSLPKFQSNHKPPCEALLALFFSVVWSSVMGTLAICDCYICMVESKHINQKIQTETFNHHCGWVTSADQALQTTRCD